MDPFPEATGRETADDVGATSAEPDAETEPDDESEETVEDHVCDPDSPVPCQFH